MLNHSLLSRLATLFALCSLIVDLSYASVGTEGASFLDIPVGSRPAALGSAYSALADDAYAPTWNPAGLGFLDSMQIAASHLSYLETVKYEYLSFVSPLSAGHALGGSIQYLGSGDIPSTDDQGLSLGTFSSHYAAYSLAYGQTFTERLALGVGAKIVEAKISDVSARSYAFDAGLMMKATPRLRLAAVVANAGTNLTFVDEGDAPPTALRLGAAYQTDSRWDFSAEGVYRKSGLASFHTGAEWNPLDALVLRAGFKTSTLKELSPIAGLTAGVGLRLWGQEFAYAWVPFGELGTTHYFSLVARFGKPRAAMPTFEENIRQHHIYRHPTSPAPAPIIQPGDSDYDSLLQLLTDADAGKLQKPERAAGIPEEGATP